MIPGLATSIIKSLLLPPGSLLILFILGLLFYRRAFGRLMMGLGLAGLYLLSISATSDLLARHLETFPAITPGQLREQGAQAIVVLGGGRYEKAPEFQASDSLSTHSLARLSYAAWLHHQTGLPLILTGGRADSDGPPEAELAAKVLDTHFNLTPLVIEGQSLNSRQHGQYLRPILQQLGIDRVAVVTQAWHMPRSILSFEQSQIQTLAAPMGYISKQRPLKAKDWLPHADALLETRILLHEYLGLVWYRLRADQRPDAS